MIFRPDIKPPMWGPPDAVQYAVRANAERMGIDPSAFLHLFPFLEGAGLTTYDFGSNIERDTNFQVWDGGSPVTLRNTDRDINIPSDTWWQYGPYIDGLTILAGHAITGNATSDQYIFARGNTASAARAPVHLYHSLSGDNAYLKVRSATAIRTISAEKAFQNNTFRNIGCRITPSLLFSAIAEDVTTTVDYSSESFGGTTNDGSVIYNIQGTYDRDPNLLGGYVYVLKTALTDAQIADVFAAPYALLMPVSRPVYFDLGATGNTDSSADPGNIAISGSSATGVKTSVSSANSGTIAIAGSVASGIRSLVSIAAAASIAISGFSAEWVYTPTGSTVSSAGPGAVAISGSPANGVQTHISSADPGTVVILGSDANAATGYATTAESGTVAITGADATASRTYVATASPASIAISGSPAYATKSGGSSTSSGISLIFGKVILHL